MARQALNDAYSIPVACIEGLKMLINRAETSWEELIPGSPFEDYTAAGLLVWTAVKLLQIGHFIDLKMLIINCTYEDVYDMYFRELITAFPEWADLVL